MTERPFDAVILAWTGTAPAATATGSSVRSSRATAGGWPPTSSSARTGR